MINDLLKGNRRFVDTVFERERDYFAELAKAQHPTVLWIGCSDSRVPVNTITQTRPGEIFVHRNVANIVAGADWNLSAVLEFSINHLNIPDIVICGHYGCGGILALEQASEHELANAAAKADLTGMYCDPHTGVALAVLEKLVARGEIKPDDRTVVISTAHGLKFTQFKVDYHDGALNSVESQYANPPIYLPADVKAVKEAIARRLPD